MHILWHSNHPDDKTGYGRQTALWVPALASLGHDVAISAFHGAPASRSEWQGFPVYPGGDDQWGMDVVGAHARDFEADLVITLMDCWPADPAGLAGLKVAHWVPVDCDPLGAGDRLHLEQTGGTPVAMSRHGEKMLRAAGLDPLYVPHGIDAQVFTPILAEGRKVLRRLAGLPNGFIVGINAANNDKHRKSFAQQFQAFAACRARHADAVLLLHTRSDNSAADGLDLRALARACGLEPGRDVFFTDQYAYRTGAWGDDSMANWYRCLDVLSLASHAEGFGLPLIEAQACGIPVVTTRASAMTELCRAGWLADGEPFWNWRFQSWWRAPSVRKITDCYEKAYRDRGRLSGRAREFALGYDVRLVLKQHWQPALTRLLP